MTLIYLVRHAQASHGDATDFHRELTAKGIEQSKDIGDWLRNNRLVPDVVIVSSSARTCQTLVHMAIDSREVISDDAYNATEDELLEIVRACQGDSKSVMIIAHNPGISLLAMRCGYDRELRTGEVVVVESIGKLEDFDPEQAKVIHHHHPNV